MRTLSYTVVAVLLVVPRAVADVRLTELDDRIRVEIDGQLFTEWRYKEWLGPYFYPVIGPNGETITRHYPMKDGVADEAQDHPHHRSLRFAHSDVNGLNFWYWRPGRERELSNAEIKLEKVEKLSSGAVGELVLWNRWLDGDKLVLRERMHARFIPLERRQVLLDYNVTLAAGDEPVVFGDTKDGGMYVRVAGTMKVQAHREAGSTEFKGTILNSRGHRNAEAWGKRAEWVDYFGPDASGRTVGIAMFDHPDNLRFPVHWHARTYGLLAANRFGADHFDPHLQKPPGTSCRPYGDDCPACKSQRGAYTIPAGQGLELRHRFYFHHGDAKAAKVAEQYRDYTRALAGQGEFAGEVTVNSVLLQTRLTATAGLDVHGDVPGASGVACFEYAASPDFRSAKRTDWTSARADRDFIVRHKLTGLKPDTTYFYRALIGTNRKMFRIGPVRQFRTHPGAQTNRQVSFCVGSCMIYERFMDGTSANKRPLSTTHEDRRLGYPSFAAMTKLKPNFFVGTGDIVYYDWPRTKEHPAATALPELRKKWHEQFRFPRLVEFFGRTPAYWSKDDHDFRYDDADHTGPKLPSPETGIDLFREQLPIVPAGDAEAPTYRTHRVSKHLQIWLTEGRDHRSPNKMPDGPAKSLWGKTQREWLQRTLKESDATWKILISPTPMVGPDGKHKKDSHANLGGFQHEANEFFAWLKRNEITGFFTVCGDRHWQFHSIHPSGVEEFGCGALNDENAILGHAPGDPRSTDPDGLIKQPFKYAEPTGGFLHIVSRKNGTLRIEFRNDRGEILHEVEKPRDVSWLDDINTAPEEVPTDFAGRMEPLLSMDGKPIRSVEQWWPRRKQLLQAWTEFLGEVAQRPAKSDYEILETQQLEGFVRQRIRYENEPDQQLEAWLLKPAGRAKPDSLPGIIALHQTTNHTIDEIAGVAGPEMQHLAPKLAQRGFVVICPKNYLWVDVPSIPEAARMFSERKPGVLGMSKMLYDARRATDILENVAEVDPTRLCAIGHSLGSKETLYLAAFDRRIRAAVSSEGGLTFRSTNWNAPWYLGKAIDESDFARNHHELLALIAPRPFLILGGESGRGAADGDRSWPLISAAQEVYRLWDQPVRLGMLNHRQGHSIPNSGWEKSVQWLDTYLGQP